MRIAFVYTPIWLVIICTLGIYLAIGLKVLRKGTNFWSLSKRLAIDREPANVLPGRHISADLTIKVETKMETHFEPQSSRGVPAALFRSASQSSFGSARHLSTVVHAQPPLAHSSHIPGSIYDGTENSGYRATAFATDRLDVETDAYHPMSMINDSYMDANIAAWNYFKVALLMFIALVCVWIPSSVNRLQRFINKDNPLFGLQLVAALGLPLQGFWNSVVYVSTTLPECKRATAEVLGLVMRRKRSTVLMGNRQKARADGASLEFSAVIPLAEFNSSRQPERHQNTEVPAGKDVPSTNFT